MKNFVNLVIDEVENKDELIKALKAQRVNGSETYQTPGGGVILFSLCCQTCGGVRVEGSISDDEWKVLEDLGYSDSCIVN